MTRYDNDYAYADNHPDKLTKDQLAKLLNGRQYGSEITDDEARQAKDAGLVVVFGASDDLMEFQGAIDEELDVYDGGVAYLKKSAEGNWLAIEKSDWDENFGGDAPTVTAIWEPGLFACSWQMDSNIPHRIFEIYEGKDLYCIGMVFSVNDLS